MMKKLKVLFVHGGILSKAGTESYMISILNNVDPEKVQIDFMVFGVEEGYYDKELLERGVKIYRMKYQPKDFFKGAESMKSIKKRIQAEHYDIAHVHMNAFNAPIIALCKRWGIHHTVAHSHTNMFMVKSKMIIALKKVLKKKTPRMADLLVACSKDAGEFQFGDAKFHVVQNGIDIEHFTYNEVTRNKLREELNLENRFVLGNIGRFNFQKNHEFLIDVFYHFKKLDPQGSLLLIGEGELENQVRSQIKKLNLEDVHFLGIIEDVAPYLNAMDAFVLPSRFEGLGIVLIEAQASGLECYASEAVPREAGVSSHCHFLPLEDAQMWAQAIFDVKDQGRYDINDQIYKAGYDAAQSAQHLIDLYKSII